jgi:hypothetical protein
VDRDTALKVWQGESFLSVTSIGGSDQIEEGVIFRNRNQRSIAEGPANRGKIAAEHPYLAYERT